MEAIEYKGYTIDIEQSDYVDDPTKDMTPEDRKASTIVTNLKNKVAKNGYYENLGQNELRAYRDEVNKHYDELTYPERFRLTEMLSISIDNI